MRLTFSVRVEVSGEGEGRGQGQARPSEDRRARGKVGARMDSRKNANLVKGALALRTESCLQPSGFKFSVMDEECMDSVTLSAWSTADGNLPNGIKQFFSPRHTDVWSFFMQEKGEFLWAFKRTGPTTMDVHKVMGKTVQRADEVKGEVDLLSSVPCPPVYDFHIYDIKPVLQNMGCLSTDHQDRGLYIKEGDKYYVDFMVWMQSCLGTGMKNLPPIVMHQSAHHTNSQTWP